MLDALLRDLPDDLVHATEGAGTWSPHDVVAHLSHGERTDWMPRVHHLLTHGAALPFRPFDMRGHEEARGRSMTDLLDEFASLRTGSLDDLAALGVSDADLDKPGLHPALGPVTLGQLIATWVTHDLDHVMQISRVLGRQYSAAVGPWQQYLRIARAP
ncbi:hypothetical protein TBR22_A10700 [Luteitalea sp. TBR-22]|nr:hypothetical protein TBR22_A10700 [Luteitalea sp. TBR-22]